MDKEIKIIASRLDNRIKHYFELLVYLRKKINYTLDAYNQILKLEGNKNLPQDLGDYRNIFHAEFNEVMYIISESFNRFNIKGKLFSYTKRLEKYSNFDWGSNEKKFNRFMEFYDKVLYYLNFLMVREEGYKPKTIHYCNTCKKETKHTIQGIMEGTNGDKLILYNCSECGTTISIK